VCDDQGKVAQVDTTHAEGALERVPAAGSRRSTCQPLTGRPGPRSRLAVWAMTAPAG
jgi:hypothetical protein